MDDEPTQPTYEVGQEVNGYVWTGIQWMPAPRKRFWPRLKTWEIVLLTVAVAIAVFGLSVAQDVLDIVRR
jgi:hypothetical protein